MKNRRNRGRIIGQLILFMVLTAGTVGGWVALTTINTIDGLLNESKQLKVAIGRLTREDQIGYAKVLKQETKNGRLFTTLAFIETARGDKLKQVLRREYTIEGDVIHFDALVVKFTDKAVQDGSERAMYLWRRVYGEHMAPSAGLAIETEGAEPQRYRGMLDKLPVAQQEMFWEAIWELANDPDMLRQHDIEAIYGSVVYKRLRKGLIYVFKISGSGQLVPESVPDM
jgi:hypothetical protein